MNLNTERKVKFWLGTVSKVLIIALVLFQLGPHLFGRKDKNINTKPIDSGIVLDNPEQERKIDNSSKQDVSEQKTQPINEKDQSELGNESIQNTNRVEKNEVHVIPNSASVYIFNGNTLDTQVGKQLEATYLNGYEMLAVESNFNKEQLLAGDVISFGSTEVVCVGTIHYSSKEDNSKTTCELTINFDTFSTKTGIKLKEFSNSLSRYGIGFSKEQARQNAIKKIH